MEKLELNLYKQCEPYIAYLHASDQPLEAMCVTYSSQQVEPLKFGNY